MSLTNKESRILNNHREILWLQRQIANLEKEEKTDLEAQENTIPSSATDEHVEESLEEYKKHIDTLKTNLDMLYQFNKSKELLTTAANNHHLTLDVLYPEPSDHDRMESKKTVEQKVNRRDELVVQFMKMLQQLNKKKTELTQIQRRIIQQHNKNKNMTAKINEIRENTTAQQNKEPGSAELLKEISALKDEVATMRGVLNGIILESGISWTEDERWFDTMLRIGEPL